MLRNVPSISHFARILRGAERCNGASSREVSHP